MAGVSAYMEKALLDWSLGGATPTRPTAWGLGLSLGSPTSISASEVAVGSGWTRQTIAFAAAASPAGSASNSLAATFGAGLTAAVFSGFDLFDTASSVSGNMLFNGLLATARTLGVGDSLVFAAGAITVTLS